MKTFVICTLHVFSVGMWKNDQSIRLWIDCFFFSLCSSFSYQGELPGIMWDLQQGERLLLDYGGAVLQQHTVCC